MQLRLVDMRDASTRWSKNYDREMAEILAVHDDVALEVTRELGVQLEGGGRSAAPRYKTSLEAKELYWKAMDRPLTRPEAGRQKAIEYFNLAIKADSNFAAAYAGLAMLYVRGGPAALAEQAALKALHSTAHRPRRMRHGLGRSARKVWRGRSRAKRATP
jgi:tetratricopeptide (TPR) repeat protein